MLFRKVNGFTLVELLVVIAIIGVLAAALTTQFTKIKSNAQAMKCKANLRNLAQAALSYGVEHERLPHAGSYELSWPAVNAQGKYEIRYFERPGWVQWTGNGKWSNKQMQSTQMKKACYYGDTAYLSVTNGTLWSYVGKDLAAYACDVHKGVAKRKGLDKVLRSYVMNGYFAFDHKASPSPVNMPADRWIALDSLSSRGNAGNLLMFAELPAFNGVSHAEKVATDQYKTGSDSVLETAITGYSTTQTEVLGFNHQVAKRYVAHVAFADGHVDVLVEPQGVKDADMKELARQLCNGEEVSQDLRDKMR